MNIRRTLRNITVVSVLAGAIGISVPAVDAQPRVRARVVVRPNVIVPQAISFRHPGPYGQFYAGRVYYRPHHHYHTTYNLPVVVRHRVVYRPYNYCRGQLFVRHSRPLPPLAFHVVFGDTYDDDRYFSYNQQYGRDYYEDDQYDDRRGDRYYDDRH